MRLPLGSTATDCRESYGEFLHRALSCRAVANQFFVRANGVTRFGLSQTSIRCIRLPIPPLSEQAAVARFLDHATSRIERYIRTKEKLIALVEEQKRAIIHQAVTGRIDVRTGRPYPSYRVSGVQWLRRVPSHWDTRRSKRVFRARVELAQPNDIQLSATQAWGGDWPSRLREAGRQEGSSDFATPRQASSRRG